MAISSLSENKIKLSITNPSSRVRICDINGNHIKKPTQLLVDFNNHYIEWMIKNDELIEIIKWKLTRAEISSLINELSHINISLVDSDYRVRTAQKIKIAENFNGFNVFKYNEIFYSFERILRGGVTVKITFKMGDFTLAAHMFVLLRLDSEKIHLVGPNGLIINHNQLGSRAYCSWDISKIYIKNIAKTLAMASNAHRDSLIGLLAA